MTTQAQIIEALGGHNHVFKNGRCIACDLTEKQINALTAAAEVGEKEITSVDVALAVEAATIERCAQVAHDWLKHHGYEIEGIECAAAIRALKDKP